MENKKCGGYEMINTLNCTCDELKHCDACHLIIYHCKSKLFDNFGSYAYEKGLADSKEKAELYEAIKKNRK